jgi:hypothetical protein
MLRNWRFKKLLLTPILSPSQKGEKGETTHQRANDRRRAAVASLVAAGQRA